MPEAVSRREDAADEQTAINRCIEENLRNTRRIAPGRQGLSVSEEIMYIGGDGEFYDELTGQWLDPDLVKQAREEEMAEYKKHGVYQKVAIKECWDETEETL